MKQYIGLPKEIAIRGQTNLFKGSFENCKFEIEKILLNVLEGQSLSDVPLGVFLSGGIELINNSNFNTKNFK